MVEDEAVRPTGRLYPLVGGDRDRPANWLAVRTREGRRVGVFLAREDVELYASRHPGRVFLVTAWFAGRPDVRYTVEGTWSRRVRWAVKPRP